jgi:hypothetical protein
MHEALQFPKPKFKNPRKPNQLFERMLLGLFKLALCVKNKKRN